MRNEESYDEKREFLVESGRKKFFYLTLTCFRHKKILICSRMIILLLFGEGAGLQDKILNNLWNSMIHLSQ